MDKAQCLHQFWSSFGLTAYDENTVPDSAALPYITYEVSQSSIDEPVTTYASLWYRSTSWAAISQKVDQIGERIGIGGVTLLYEDGLMWVNRGFPFSQRMGEPSDPAIRRILINVSIEYLSED